MKNLFALIVFPVLLLWGASAQAGAVMRFSTEDATYEPVRKETFTILGDANRLKAEVPAASDRRPGAGIFVADRDLVVILDHEARTYSPVTRQQALEFGAQLNQTVNQIGSVLESLPEDQRGMLEGLIGGALGQSAPAAESELVDTGKTATVGGIGCRQLDAFEAGRLVGVLCIADWQSVPAGTELSTPVAALASFIDEVSLSLVAVPGLPAVIKGGVMRHVDDLGGMPIYVAHYDETGSKIFEARLQSIQQQTVEESSFAIPAGYTESPLL